MTVAESAFTSSARRYFAFSSGEISSQCHCGEGGVVQRSLQREKDSGDSGK